MRAATAAGKHTGGRPAAQHAAGSQQAPPQVDAVATFPYCSEAARRQATDAEASETSSGSSCDKFAISDAALAGRPEAAAAAMPSCR